MAFEEFLKSIGNFNIYLVIVATIILCILKKKEGALFAGITSLFFIVGTAYYPYLIDWDTERFFRYPIWFFHELAWMGTIAYLGLNDKVSMKQSIIGQLLGIPLLAVNLFRGIDYHYMDLFASTDAYRLIYPICEVLIVTLCWLPVFAALKNQLFPKTQTA